MNNDRGQVSAIDNSTEKNIELVLKKLKNSPNRDLVGKMLEEIKPGDLVEILVSNVVGFKQTPRGYERVNLPEGSFCGILGTLFSMNERIENGIRLWEPVGICLKGYKCLPYDAIKGYNCVFTAEQIKAARRIPETEL